MAARKGKPASSKVKRALNRKIDEEVEETFPASDPPAFMGGKHAIGAPGPRRTPPPKPARKQASRKQA